MIDQKNEKEFEEFTCKGTQYLIAASVDDWPFDYDPWSSYPAWDVDTACKAITLSRMIDIEESRRIGNLDSKIKVFENPSIARHICYVYDRAKNMAEMAINIGDLNEFNTPIKWINWAEKNRYSVKHLEFILDSESMEVFQQRIDDYEDFDFSDDEMQSFPIIKNKQSWSSEARMLGEAYIKQWKLAGYEPTVDNAALYIEGIFITRGIHNTRLNFIDRNTIKKEALAGITGNKKGFKSKKPKIPLNKIDKLPNN